MSVDPAESPDSEETAVNPVTEQPSEHPTGKGQASQNEQNDPPA